MGDVCAACAAVARAIVQAFFSSEPSKVWLFTLHSYCWLDFPLSSSATLVPVSATFRNKVVWQASPPTRQASLTDATHNVDVFGKTAGPQAPATDNSVNAVPSPIATLTDWSHFISCSAARPAVHREVSP
jgi:hypothetical protein